MWGRIGALVSLCMIGCAADPSDGSSPAAVWCQSLCTAERRCFGATITFSSSLCLSECVSMQTVVSHYSVNGSRALAPCIQKVSCSTFDSEAEWTTNMHACWEQAKLSVEVTSDVRRFCADYARVWFECGYSFPVGECEGVYSMWAPPVVDSLATCVDSPTCDALRACDAMVFDNL